MGVARRPLDYELVTQAEPEVDAIQRDTQTIRGTTRKTRRWMTFALAFTLALTLCLALNYVTGNTSSFHSPNRHLSNTTCSCSPTPSVPQYFQTTPELWAGPTPTGNAAFLAQTRTWQGDYIPNSPLQTAVPIPGSEPNQKSIFQMMGYLSPYTPSPGFGVDEFPLPRDAEILQVQMLSRHGARYPTSGANVMEFAERIAKAKGKGDVQFSEELDFLSGWEYALGGETLVPKGRMELFESGVLHAYMYGGLYNPGSKIIVRTTTQDRMLKSAENFLAGFFGLEWTRNATVEVIIEERGFNNSLAGDLNCPNAGRLKGGTKAAMEWIGLYLKNATERLNAMADGYEWTLDDTYAAQTMCPYETVAYGYSKFCELFTHDEWKGFEYSVDLWFHGDFSFASPTGRAVGIGYQQEVLARLNNHTLGYSGSQINVTLDNNTDTFPLNQTLYFDFSHDTTIIAILTAFGLKQFSTPLDPTVHPGDHNFTVTHLTPFGARLDIEIIRTPKPLAADRSSYLDGASTKYIHFILNQRTIPLGLSLPGCDASRVDGWCEMSAFLKEQKKMPDLARFQEACYRDYPLDAKVEDGAPP
ncbi:histidine phosphatase superfamily [Podospora aff. communis PSN243]|uniref:3-phytase n=1 Tax=Podospora aff. communis PSN243 TaxID=3040156 RepID=A0AAV9GP49_9PEZI|nr:histidine phosphatase superfamily [Podospora aff. communis PSN243]